MATQELRATLASEGAAKRVFEKVRPDLLPVQAKHHLTIPHQVYTQDILRLLKMEDMWKHRQPPHPLSYTELEESLASGAQAAETSAAGSTGIKDQRPLSLTDSFALFVSR